MTNGIADRFSGLTTFRESYDAARSSKHEAATPITREELGALKQKLEATRGRLLDGRAQALDYIRNADPPDPALADTLSRGGSYDDYIDALIQRSNAGQPGPQRIASPHDSRPTQGRFEALPTEIQQRVRSLVETFDVNVSATVSHKAGMARGVLESPEGQALAKDLEPYGLSLTDAMRQSRKR